MLKDQSRKEKCGEKWGINENLGNQPSNWAAKREGRGKERLNPASFIWPILKSTAQRRFDEGKG